MTAPLYQLKAEFFRTLGHPARIRILELLLDGERSVADLLPEVGLETSHLSQQLGVLRRAGVVISRKQGCNAFYRLASPDMAELMATARRVLTGMLAGQVDLLADLHADAIASSRRQD
ncbi:MAG: metalloregulator ArsR/SmtB family transcription factor [Nakamurella sp.]